MDIDVSALTATQWVECTSIVVWLAGIGLLAHTVPVVLKQEAEHDPFIDTGLSMFPERAALAISLVIVSWPLSVPVMSCMSRKRR